MNSKSPFSTISYNTEPWLKNVLENYISNGKFVFYSYIFHKGEDDEAGLKDHFHVYIEPNSTFNTVKFTNDCIEPCNQLLPLKSMPCHSSDFGNWYMYVLHDENYLKYKGLGDRKYHYNQSNFIYSDLDYFNYKIRTIDLLDTSWYSSMLEAIARNESFDEYFAKGGIPVQQVKNYEYAYNMLVSYTYRKKALDKQSN